MTFSWKKITFEITNRCNLRCRICNIWKERPKRDLAVRDIETMISSMPSPVSISLTGGEPFCYPSLPALYKRLYILFLKKKVHHIDMATNGTSASLKRFLDEWKKTPAPLSFSISLDGLPDIHDRQRGRPGAFQQTLHNLLLIKKLGLPLVLKFVITPLNYHQMEQVLALSKKFKTDIYFKFFEMLPSYYHRLTTKGMELKTEEFQQISGYLRKIRLQGKEDKTLKGFSLDLLEKYARDRTMAFIQQCSVPASSLFVNSQGDIYNCLNQEKIGTLLSWPSFKEHLAKKIVRRAHSGSCPKCLSYHGFLQECNRTLP